MKNLLIVRHGKSSWDDADLADHERPLAPRGEQAVPLMGERLRARGVVPDRLVSSDAVRARRTAELLAEALGLEADAVVLDERLYHAEADDCFTVIREFPDECACVALVGHNPTLHELAEHWVDLRVGKFPTAAVVHARFDVDRWADMAPGNAALVDLDYPKKASN